MFRLAKEMITKRMATGIILFLGLATVLLTFVPSFQLGGYSRIEMHDQLDGEVLSYIMHAKHPFSSSYDEFMNGMAATSLTPPSYGTVLFYILFEPYTAFMVNYVFVAMVAFAGMYLLLYKITGTRWLAGVVGLLFAQLPFYSVYGLSVMGQPLLFYACLCIWTEEKPIKAYLLTGLFAAFTSLVLSGYADLLILLAVAVVMQLRKHPAAKRGWIQLGILLGVLLLPNLSLVGQMLLPGEVVSHKSELVAGASGFWDSFRYAFRTSQYHAVSLHQQLIPWLQYACVIAAIFYGYWTAEEKSKLWWLWGTLAAAVCIAGIYAAWHHWLVVDIRNFLGGVFVSFQVDRFYWLNPMVWFTGLGLIGWFLLQLARRKGIQRIAAWFLLIILLGNMGKTIDQKGYVSRNYRMVQDGTGESNIWCWNAFYSTALFDEIEAYIGLPQEDYRVGSVALYPAVPLYNGFYCIDGYSNNYDVEYKHAFREIISKELEKNAGLKNYYDGWGNRCYLYSAEIGQQYYFSKWSGQTIENLELSNEALKKLGCDYIMSGVEIKNYEDSGLEFLKSFSNQTDYYQIFLYKVV